MTGSEEGHLWSVKNGNHQVPEILIKSACANLNLNTCIKSVTKTLNLDGRPVFTLQTDSSLDSRVEDCEKTYDAVIVAVPLDVPSCYINFDSCQKWPQQKQLGKYQQTITTLVQGDIRMEYFNSPSGAGELSAILTTEDSKMFFSSIGSVRDIEGNKTNPTTYKIFSREHPSEKDIHALFEIDSSNTDSLVKSVAWLAYPKYEPPEQFLPFHIEDGVFYVNAMERAASDMEMCALAGRNVALLTAQYIERLFT